MESSLARTWQSGSFGLESDQHLRARDPVTKYSSSVSTRPESTHREEDPLQHLTVFIRLFIFIETKLILLVIKLVQVQQDCSCFKDDEAVPCTVHQDRNASIWVQLEKPRLLLDVRGYVDILDSITVIRTVFPNEEYRYLLIVHHL